MTHQAHRVLFSHPCRRGFPARSRAFVLALAAGLFALLLAPAGFAAPVKFDIPGQPAPAALQQFIRQSGHDVLFSYDQLATVQTKAVQGEFEPAEALAHLLAESGFVITPQGARKFLVAPPPPKTGSIEGSVREADSSRPVAGASVTVAGTELSVQTDRRGRFTLSEVPAGEHELRVTAEGLQTTRVVDVSVRGGHRHTLSPVGIPQRRQGVTQLEDFVVSAKKNDGVVELDPFDVEGRREKPFTANMDIPRGINDVQAYYIFDSKSIEMSGATTVEDFLATNVTMNVLRSTNSSNTTSYGTNSASNLRGLGEASTLILVNGRRQPNTNVAGSVYQPDINGIPPSAIDRIEVLPTSASGIYGGSAVGGVINIVLKKNYQGGEIRAGYANTWDGDANRRTLDFNWGRSFEDGRTNVRLSASYADGNAIRLQDRADIIRRNYATIFRNFPDFLYTEVNPFGGATTNISNSVAAPLVLKSGTSLGSRITHIPSGLSPNASSAELNAALLQNAGSYNLDLPSIYMLQTGLGSFFGFTPTSRSFSGSVTRQFLPNLEAFLDYSWSRNRGVSLYSSYFNTNRTVAANAPTNPFTTAVVVRAPAERLRPRIGVFDKEILTFGFKATLPHEWIALIDFSHVAEDADHTFEAVDNTAVNNAFANGAINPFADTQLFRINLDPYATLNRLGTGSTQNSISARASGPLPQLPWGQPTLTVGLENRLTGTTDGFSQTTLISTGAPVGNFSSFLGFKQVSASAYAEINMPLIESGRWPLAHSLELQAAARTERFTVATGTSNATINPVAGTVTYTAPTIGGQPYRKNIKYESTDPTVGLKFQPVPSVTVRASYGTAYLPPTSAQLRINPEPSVTLTTINDPQTGTSYGVRTLSGGNPNIKPQSSESRNAGIIWEPREGKLRGLRLNAEYYEIEQADAISTLSAQLIINLFPERVTRDSVTGLIDIVDTSSLNLYARELKGWDFTVSYRHQTANLGSFNFRGTQSLFLKSLSQFSLTAAPWDGVNFPTDTANGGTLRHQTNLNLSWERGPWTAGWNSRLLSSYRVYGAAGGPLSSSNAGGANFGGYVQAQGRSTIPAQDFHDIVVGYAFPKAATERGSFANITEGMSLTVGIRNVFNAAPEFDTSPWGLGFLSPFANIRMREYWINLTKKF